MKTCFKCKKEKPLSEFYKHPQMKDGYLNKCKPCAKEDATASRNKNIEKVREYDRQRGKLPHRIKFSTKTTKRLREQFPLKYKAQTAVNNAVRDGRLIKPVDCSACDKKGRQIEGHHDDYSKPLEVIWLCSPCHKQLHRDLRNI
jgi:hypothetical protein